jgi:hypothetical protein
MFKKADQKILMGETNDYQVYTALPDEIIIYRGLQNKKAKKRGLSWTLDKNKAVWFAHRFNQKNQVLRAKIRKEHIFMYTNCRGESEVVVNSKFLKEICPEAPNSYSDSGEEDKNENKSS